MSDSDLHRKVFVVSLEGEPATGKSTILSGLGFPIILHEGFGSSDPHDVLHPQSFSRELEWAVDYFKRIRIAASRFFKKGTGGIIVTDRSPYSAVIFADSNNDLLYATIRAMEDEHEKHGMKFFRVRLFAGIDTLRDRILSRIDVEPWRKELHEDDIEYMMGTRNKYDRYISLWDTTVRNDEGDIVDVIEKVRQCIGWLTSTRN